MKNVSISLKFMVIAGLFGVFSLAVAAFSTSQMWSIDQRYSDLGAGPTHAAFSVNRAAQAILVLILAGVAALMGGSFVLMRMWGVSPMNALSRIMTRLAGGDLAAHVDGIDRGDELGGMARAVQVFKDAGLEKIRLETVAEDARRAAEEERQRNMLQSQDAAERQSAVVHAVALGLDHLSDGDLTFRLRDTFPSEYEKLRTDFNGAIDKTGRALEKIGNQVNDVSSVVVEIASSAQEQATGLHEVNTAVNQMDQITQQNAAMVEQSTAASHALLGESEELAKLIGQFRTSQSVGAAQQHVPAARPARAVPQAQPALKQVGPGGAVRQPTVEPDAGWDEF